MRTDTDELILHIAVDHIALAVLPQLSICIDELDGEIESLGEEVDARLTALRVILEEAGDAISDAIIEAAQDIDGIYFPTDEEIEAILEEYDEDFEEPEEGFLGFMQQITQMRDEEDDDDD